MSQEDELILGLCRVPPRTPDSNGTAIGGAAIESLDWNRVLARSDRNQVQHLILGALARIDLPPERAEEVARLEREEFVESALVKGAIRETLDRVSTVLRESELEFVLMKGFSLDFDKRRPFRDLDILVRERDLERVLEVLERDGQVYVGDAINHHVRSDERGDFARQLSWNNQFQLRDEQTGVLVEVHTNLFQRRRTHALDLDALLERVGTFFEHRRSDPELDCHVVSDDLQLVMMALYTSIKYSPAKDNFRLGVLVDVDRIVRRGVDWDSIVGYASEFQVVSHVLFALTLAQRLLDTPVPSETLEELAAAQSARERLATRMHLASYGSLERNSLFASKAFLVATPFLLGSRWSDRLRWMFLLPILFPPRWRMAQYFHLSEDSPLVPLTYLVNPLRWVALVARRALP